MGSRVLVETDDHLKPRIIALIIVAGVLAIAAIIAWRAGPQLGFAGLKEAFTGGTVTPLTLLLAGLASGLFFLPVPAEIAFVYGLQQGVSALWGSIAVVAGFATGHVISYLVGLKLSNLIRYFISPKKLYGMRRKVNRWGGYAILVFNLLPLPSPQLTFGLGIARYNFTRLMALVLLGNAIKYAAISVFIRFW